MVPGVSRYRNLRGAGDNQRGAVDAVDPLPGNATGGIEQPGGAWREAETRTRGPQVPHVVTLGIGYGDAASKIPYHRRGGTPDVADAEVDFQATDDGAGLPVVTGLAAKHPAGAIDTAQGYQRNNRDHLREIVGPPAVPGVHADIEAAPGPRVRIGGACRGGAEQHRHACERANGTHLQLLHCVLPTPQRNCPPRFRLKDDKQHCCAYGATIGEQASNWPCAFVAYEWTLWRGARPTELRIGRGDRGRRGCVCRYRRRYRRHDLSMLATVPTRTARGSAAGMREWMVRAKAAKTTGGSIIHAGRQAVSPIPGFCRSQGAEAMADGQCGQWCIWASTITAMKPIAPTKPMNWPKRSRSLLRSSGFSMRTSLPMQECL